MLNILLKTEKGNLPNLIIIGAAKCGTTSLHYYLGLHPEISMSKEKELNFFAVDRQWNKGIDWYKSNFEANNKIQGESSPSYTVYPLIKDVPKKMHSVIPDAKLIYSIRDPIERIISHYVQNYTIGLENRKIENALSQLDHNPYVLRSMYFTQLEQYLAFFRKSNILIITLEDLNNQRIQTLRRVFRFLDVDEDFYSPKFQIIKHDSKEKGRKNRIGLFLKRMSETNFAKIFSTHMRMNIGKILYRPFSTSFERPVLTDEIKNRLGKHLEDDICRLRKYTGLDFKDWSV